MRRLDEVCTIIMGQAPSGEAYNFDGEGWPLIAGAGDFEGTTPAPKKYTTEASKLSTDGDIIIGIRASIGDKVLSDGEYCLGRGVAALRPSPHLDLRYLWQWLDSVREELASKGRGATFKQVNRDDIGELKVPSLPLEEQKRIAEVLDGVDALRAKRRHAIALLDDLAQSIFLDMFGDPATNPKGWPLRQVADLIDSATYGTSEKSSSSGDLPVLRMNNVTSSGQIDLSDLKYMDRASTPEKYLVRKGDVLFNRTNSAELVGKTAIYRGTEPLAFAGYLVRVKVNKANHPEYFAAFMNTRYAKLVLRKMCKSIIGMANINAKEMQRIAIAEPPYDLQQQFAERIEAIEVEKAKHRAHLAKLDELFNSVQSRAFAGTLFG
jgi:type I restriction enzyme S subunit